MKTNRRGFNLIELIVILAIIAVLMALLLPAVQKVREAGAKTNTINNMKQMALALHSANDVNRKLPPAYDKFGSITFPAALHVHLLPYIEQAPLYQSYLKQEGGGNTKDAMVPPFIAPDDRSHGDKTAGIQNSAANLRVFTDKGVGTNFDASLEAPGDTAPGNSGIPRTFTDGTSNTVVFATKLAVCGEDGGSRYASKANTKFAAFFGQNAAQEVASPDSAKSTFQLAPDQKQCLTSPLMGQSFDKRGILVGLGDASVRTVSFKVAAKTWNCALQPNDGNPLPADWDN